MSITVATAAIFGVAAAPAGASEARVADGVLRVVAAPGEANDILVTPAPGGRLTVTDQGAAPDAGSGCVADSDGVVCTGASSIYVATGDGDDAVSVDAGVSQPATLEGGDGSDSLIAGGGPAVLRGAAGDDGLIGSDAADTIDGGSGKDYVAAGDGADNLLLRDGQTDTASCGDGQDTARVDAADSADADCESLSTTDGSTGASTDGPTGPSTDGSGTGAAVQPPSGGAGTGSGGTGTVPGAQPRRSGDSARCSAHGRRTAVCSVRLLRRKPSGVLHLTLRSGPVVIASGRGRIRNGVARVRLRVHLPVGSGGYALRAEVDRGSGKKPITRLLTVGILGGEMA